MEMRYANHNATAYQKSFTNGSPWTRPNDKHIVDAADFRNRTYSSHFDSIKATQNSSEIHFSYKSSCTVYFKRQIKPLEHIHPDPICYKTLQDETKLAIYFMSVCL